MYCTEVRFSLVPQRQLPEAGIYRRPLVELCAIVSLRGCLALPTGLQAVKLATAPGQTHVPPANLISLARKPRRLIGWH